MPRPEIRNLKSKIRSLLVYGFRIQASGFLIALALALASCVQEPRYAPQSGAAGNQPDQHAPPAQQEAARPRVIHPTTFICVFPATPHTKAHEQRGPIPPGKKIDDLCPPGAHTYLAGPSVPHRSHAPPPGVMIHWTSTGYTLHPTQKPQPDTGGKSQ